MIKRIISLLTAAALLLSSAAFAMEEAEDSLVYDYAGLFSDVEVEELKGAIVDFQETTGYDFAVLVTYEDLGDPDYQQICDDFYVEHSLGLGMNQTAVLCFLDLYGDGYYYISVYGDLGNLMVAEDIQYLAEEGMNYFQDGDFEGGFLWTINMLAEALMNIGSMNQSIRVYDYAEMFSEEEAATLESAIADFRALSGMDFLYLSTDNELQGNDNGDYMGEFYGKHGFGEGENRSGAMIYLDLFSGSYYVQNFGDMRDYVTQSDLDTIVNAVNTPMGEGAVLEAVLMIVDAYAAFFQ